ncbi:MAG: DNA methyltransferase [Candidatus Woesearchaeota archaeon]
MGKEVIAAAKAQEEMKVFFQLYKRHADIAAAEALEVVKGKKIALYGNEILIADAKSAAFQRLGLSHAAFELLFSCKTSQLAGKIQKFSWQKHYKKSFKVTVHHSTPEKEREIAQKVANCIKNPKAEMKNPKSWFHFFLVGDNVIAGKLLWQNNEDFEGRKVHKWPAPHPTGTHPQLARAMINLTGIQKGVLVDPFCGAGGILIEACLMGLTPVGYDINQELLEKAAKNLIGYGIKRFKLQKKNALTISKAKYVVADLPYGRNTPPKGLEELYVKFLARLKKVLEGRAVLGFPSTINHKPLIRKAGLNVLNEFSWEINRNLRKNIVVVTP